jgi:uncharacterized membrane protein
MNDTRTSGGLGRALGVASFALGAPLLAAPGRVVRALGLDDAPGTSALARGVGVRELAAGAGILAQRRPVPGLWARVAGDGMDLALLANALRSGRAASRSGRRRRATGRAASRSGWRPWPTGRTGSGRRRSTTGANPRTVAAVAAVAGIAAVDVLAAVRAGKRLDPTRTSEDGAFTVSAGVTVNRSVDDAYGLWRDFSRLPEFMVHLESVSADGKHWVARRPGGGTVDWDAEIVADVPNQRLAWRSVSHAEVPNSGEVTFEPAPGGRGTEVRVRLTYEPPLGAAGNAVARLLGEEPRQQVTDDLRRFKQVLETGEVVRSAGSPEGVRSGRLPTQRPGRPETSEES